MYNRNIFSLAVCFFLILIILFSGCSTTSSSTTENPISPKYNKIADSHFCVGHEGNNLYLTFEPPLIQNPAYKIHGNLYMPIKSGKYKITVTTDTPDADVYVLVDWEKFVGNDKFGIPQYEGVGSVSGHSNRNADYNTEVLVPESSPGGTIHIIDGKFLDEGHNCGRIIVTKLVV